MKRTLRHAHNVWCEVEVERAGLLVDGDDYYRAFYDAAQKAERTILLAGWQFDSDACLLRGADAEGAPLPVTLLRFLDALCTARPDLRIYILAWDFHAVFALEREWMQEQKFNWTTHEHLTFLFDSHHVDRASHHQKFVVIDGKLSFLGGLDLCDHRWDDRRHKDPNPLRVSRGSPHKPFHDVQAYLVGRAPAAALEALFAARWRAAGGEPLAFAEAADAASLETHHGVPLSTARVAFSRTDPFGAPSPTPDELQPSQEIRALFTDAIAGAERSIYVETQYFSSKDVCEAFVARLQRPGGAPLDIVLVLNMEAETIKEEIAVGLAQAKVLRDLRKAAEGTHHRLGVFYTVPAVEGGGEPERATYIHSKVMIVDDRFLTVGSANLTNRSMGLDTELNASFETDDPSDGLGRSIAHARIGLIEEHLGVSEARAHHQEGLVARLLDAAERKLGRLRLHPSPTPDEMRLLEVVDPQKLPFDPAAFEDDEHRKSLFANGIGALIAWLGPKPEQEPAPDAR